MADGTHSPSYWDVLVRKDEFDKYRAFTQGKNNVDKWLAAEQGLPGRIRDWLHRRDDRVEILMLPYIEGKPEVNNGNYSEFRRAFANAWEARQKMHVNINHVTKQTVINIIWPNLSGKTWNAIRDAPIGSDYLIVITIPDDKNRVKKSEFDKEFLVRNLVYQLAAQFDHEEAKAKSFYNVYSIEFYFRILLYDIPHTSDVVVLVENIGNFPFDDARKEFIKLLCSVRNDLHEMENDRLQMRDAIKFEEDKNRLAENLTASRYAANRSYPELHNISKYENPKGPMLRVCFIGVGQDEVGNVLGGSTK